MEKTKHTIIALALVLFITTVGISEESRISNTRKASCVVHITFNPDLMPLNFEDIESLLNSSGIYGNAAQEVLGSTPTDEGTIDIDSQRSLPTSTGLLTYSFVLNIELPDTTKPAANEFVKAIADNLQISLDKIYKEYFNEYIDQLNSAQRQYDEAKDKLDVEKERPRLHIIPVGSQDHSERTFIHEQLEEKVDLSEIHPGMSLSEILEILRNSVGPPLQIQPNWRNLVDIAEINRDTLCEMEPLTDVKLGKALDILLEGLSNDYADLGYIIDDGVITIATTDALPDNMVTFLYDISGLVNSSGDADSIMHAIMETIEPESWSYSGKNKENIINNYNSTLITGGYTNVPQEISYQGDGKIAIMQGNKLSIYNTPEIQDKITNFLIYFPVDFPDESLTNVPIENLLEDKQDLERQRRQLEMEVARLEARQSTAEQQIIAVSSKVKDDTNATELKKVLYDLTDKLNELKKTRTEKHPEVQSVQKRIEEIKTKIASAEGDTVTAELERLIKTQTEIVTTLKKEHEARVAHGVAPMGLPNEIIEAEEKLARLKIELARRREELARPAGIESLATFNENLSMTMLDLAEKKAELQVVEKQLSEIESQIRAASTTDPDILKIRQAKQALERAAKRLNQLKIIDENRQPPKVMVIGAD